MIGRETVITPCNSAEPCRRKYNGAGRILSRPIRHKRYMGNDATSSLFINSENTYNWLVDTAEYKDAKKRRRASLHRIRQEIDFIMRMIRQTSLISKSMMKVKAVTIIISLY